ncbi:MAG: ankyrin repeat domain-containing protein [Myxococcota bacterium]|nr:ankyrin repeat domain-containing protein [Myxococcota bacterium]
MRLAVLFGVLSIASGCCFGRAVSPACLEACAAAAADDTARLQSLASDPAVLTCQDRDGFGPIHHAAARGASSAVTWLLDHGVPLEARGGNERTALYEAAKYGQLETATLLLDRGADLETRGSTGHTPWLVAAERGHLAVLDLLLARGADTSALIHFHRDSVACHLAQGTAQAEVVTYLLAHGGTADMHDVDGFTPLHHAANPFASQEPDRTDTVQLLLDAGANPNSTTLRGSTPLDVARHRGRAAIAALLVASGGRSATDARPDELVPLTRSLTLPGVVTASGGASPAPIGTRCTVHVRPSTGQSFNCHVTVDCENGGHLYGDASTGFTYCEDRPSGLRAFDWGTTPSDGDPSAELDETARRFSVDDGLPGREGTHVRLALDPPGPPARAVTAPE